MGVLRVVMLLPLVLGACAFQSASKVDDPVGDFGPESIVSLRDHGLSEVRGEIESVDGGEVTVRTPDGIVRLDIEEETTIFHAGRIGAVGDLREGAPVRASFAHGSEGRVAAWIETPRSAAEPASPDLSPEQDGSARVKR